MTPLPFFQTPAWFDVLNRGFGAGSQWVAESVAATFFRFGPLCLAYANFPIGIRSPDALTAIMQSATRIALKDAGADILRFSTLETLEIKAEKHGVRLPETWIGDLANWTENGLDGDVRYEIRRSRREGITIRPATMTDARFMFELYRATVKRHAGRQRYTLRYFETLCRAFESSPNLRGLIAETAQQLPCGFVVTAGSDMDTHYLHAGFDPLYSHARPGYALLCAAITHARDAGCSRFNLMASPADQLMLVRFKEKWGGRTQYLVNVDIDITNIGRIAHLALKARKQLFFPQEN